MFIDMPLAQLQNYVPARQEPSDFDAFWQSTLADTRKFPLNPIFTPVETGLKTIEAFDVTYNGFGGQPIKAWLMLPAPSTPASASSASAQDESRRLPCVVEY